MALASMVGASVAADMAEYVAPMPDRRKGYAKPQRSNAAAFKRQARKRRNIRARASKRK